MKNYFIQNHNNQNPHMYIKYYNQNSYNQNPYNHNFPNQNQSCSDNRQEFALSDQINQKRRKGWI